MSTRLTRGDQWDGADSDGNGAIHGLGERSPAENPFTPHVPADPADFVNREREVELVFGHISALQRGSVAVNGPLGMGKISLLRYIAAPLVGRAYGAARPEAIILYVDIQSVTPFSSDRFWRRVARLLERETDVDLGHALTALLARSLIDVIDVEEFLDALADAGSSLVLLLDEFEWALQSDTPESEAESRNLLAQLASLMRRTPRVLALVVATEAPLPEATKVIESWRGSPFATLFTSITLKPLARRHADDLVDRALSRADAAFAPEDRELVHAVAGGVPVAVQAAAFSLYHGRAHGIDGARLREAVEAAAAQATTPRGEPEPAPPASKDGDRPPDSGVFIDRATGDVLVDGRPIEPLTALEYNLLECLVASGGRLCTKEEIVRSVWGEDLADDSRVEKLVSRLRRKIEAVPGRPQYIRTVRGRGYRLVA